MLEILVVKTWSVEKLWLRELISLMVCWSWHENAHTFHKISNGQKSFCSLKRSVVRLPSLVPEKMRWWLKGGFACLYWSPALKTTLVFLQIRTNSCISWPSKIILLRSDILLYATPLNLYSFSVTFCIRTEWSDDFWKVRARSPGLIPTPFQSATPMRPQFVTKNDPRVLVNTGVAPLWVRRKFCCKKLSAAHNDESE